MKKSNMRVCALLLALMATTATWAQRQKPMVLWYDRPATAFEESLPLGNGRLGMLVYGDPHDDVVQLNDLTLWSGKPVDLHEDEGASRWIPEIRKALFAENYAKADSLQLHVQGHNSTYYQPLGTLHIIDKNVGAMTSYRRELDLDSALAHVSYQKGGVSYRREYLCSSPDHLGAVRLTASAAGAINAEVSLTSILSHKTKAGAQQLTMTGHAMGAAEESTHFCTIVRVEHQGGTIEAADSTLLLKGVTEAIIYFVNATSFNGATKHPVLEGAPYIEEANNLAWHTKNIQYAEVKDRHVADYKHFFDRVKLNFLSGKSTYDNIPTDSLLRSYGTSIANDRYLETLYFQFGRYLLIGCSRTPAVPANLQGLWNPHRFAPWRGNYTININLEENYWPAFVANLAEMAMPLDGFIAALAETGRHTAKNYYGINRGWCAGHNSDIWAMANPVGEKNEKPEWANWPMGGAWLVEALWEHYQFTGDEAYLRETAYPLMKGAAEFCLDWLIPNPNNPQELITAPSTSPENEYVTDKGYHGMTCYGGTADLAIIRELFQNVIKAGKLCGDTVAAYEKALARLHPYTVGKDGDLNEWYHDWRDYDPRHRHQSHLIGLYPGNNLPESFYGAAEKTLIQKGEQTTGWSTGWRINLWARLHKGDQAYHIYRKLLQYVPSGANHWGGGGTYPNLFDAHPPFQIDGNFGGVAGVCEMLVQSHQGKIELLPALPADWAEGEVSGLCARGGYEVSMKWKNGQVTEATITAKNGGEVTVCYNKMSTTLKLKKGESRHITAKASQEWTLVWSDDFNEDGRPDPATWNFEQGFVRNHEDQWYQADNAWQEDGLLIIEARREDRPNLTYRPHARHWGQQRDSIHYTSACLTTMGKREFLYGRLEVCARIPTAGGSWPAIWTLGRGMEWPSCGEIDIMEFYRINGVPHILANAAWGNDQHFQPVWSSKKIPFTHFTEREPNWAQQFHVWRMDWDEKAIRLYLDDELLNATPLSTTVNGSIGQNKNPFQSPQYILLNLALGGDCGGTIDNSALPMRYEIDYVRIYQKQ